MVAAALMRGSQGELRWVCMSACDLGRCAAGAWAVKEQAAAPMGVNQDELAKGCGCYAASTADAR